MTSCVIVGAIVSCLIDPATRPTPAQAAAILVAHQPIVAVPASTDGPRVCGLYSTERPFNAPSTAFRPLVCCSQYVIHGAHNDRSHLRPQVHGTDRSR
jgi:hypothetical protein